MSERRDELDRRIEAALRRRFEPPASLDSLGARLTPRRARRVGPWLAVAAAVVAVLAFGWFVAKSTARRPPVREIAQGELRRAPPLANEPAVCREASAADTARVDPTAQQSPDLARLYRDMEACQRGAITDACEDDERQERYLSAIALRPEAAALLHGPFVSDEWPGAEILVGTSEDRTAMLVVAEGATVDCCVRPRLAEGSGLRIFQWPLGDKLLTEITPLEEPRLLPTVE